MPLDPAISLQSKGIDLPNVLSGFLNLGLQKNALERGTATLPADIERAKAESARAVTEADVAARTANPRVSAAESSASSAATGAKGAEFKLTRDYADTAFQELSGLIQNPAIVQGKDGEAAANAVIAAKDRVVAKGVPRNVAEVLFGKFQTQAHDSPQTLRQTMQDIMMGGIPHGGQQAVTTPNPAFINNGQQAIPVAAGNPALTGVAPGTPQGPGVQMQVPPTATTMGLGGQPTYVGAQPQQPAKIPSGPAIGQTEGTVGPVNVATKHYEQVVNEAQPAQTRIASLQTIKQEAPTAVTGGGDYRRKILSQLSGLFNLANDEQTANDVMAKNLAVIAGQAGNTDAARALGEMGSPNYHMTKEAIEQTANQLIGMEKKKVAAQQFFAGTPTNDPAYAQKMAVWSKVADPRLFEYAALPAEQRKAWMAKLSPGVRVELGMKAKELARLGVEP